MTTNEVNYFKGQLNDYYVGGFLHQYCVALRFDKDVKGELTQQMVYKLLPKHNSHDIIVSTYYWFLYNSGILQECSVEYDEETGCFVLIVKMNLRCVMTVCDTLNISTYNELLNKTKKGWSKKNSCIICKQQCLQEIVATNLSLLLENAGDGNVDGDMLSITNCDCPPAKNWSLKKDAKWVICSDINVTRITIEDMNTVVVNQDNDEENGLIVVVDVLGIKRAIDRAYIPIPTTTIDDTDQNDWRISEQRRRNFVLERINKINDIDDGNNVIL